MPFDITQPYSIYGNAGGWDGNDSMLFFQGGAYYRRFAPYAEVTPDTNYTPSSSVGNYQAETLAYVSNGGASDQITLDALDAFIVAGRSSGWWAELVEVWPFCGSTLAASLVKLKHAGQATLTNFNFVEADYSQADGFGTMATNTTKYLDSGFIPSASSVVYNDVCLGIEFLDYNKNNALNATWTIFSWPLGSISQTGANPQLTVGDEATGFGSQANMTTYSAYGFNLYNASASLVQSWRAGAVTRYGGTPTSATFATSITLWASKLNNNTTYYSSGKNGLIVIGNALTDAQAISLNRAAAALRKAIRKPTAPLYTSVGDSITQGSTVTSYSDTYVQQLANKFGAQLVNQAQGSASLSTTATTAVPHYYAINSRYLYATYDKSQFISLMIGTNDMANDGAVSGTAGLITTYQTNLTTILPIMKRSGARVVCAGPPYRSDTGSSDLTKQAAYTAAAAAAAKAARVPFVDMYRRFTDTGSTATYLADVVHPNDAGHRLMYAAFADGFDGLLVRIPSISPGAIGAGAIVTVAVTVLNAVAGMPVRCIPVTNPEAGVVYTAAVTANDTVTVSVYSVTALTPAALFVRLEVVCGY